jgi:hypothetical protein
VQNNENEEKSKWSNLYKTNKNPERIPKFNKLCSIIPAEVSTNYTHQTLLKIIRIVIGKRAPFFTKILYYLT